MDKGNFSKMEDGAVEDYIFLDKLIRPIGVTFFLLPS
jgi:hypothetical protein